MNELVETFIKRWLEFDLQLREKDGLNETVLEELVELLKQMQIVLRGKPSMPKKLSEIFLDMWGAMTSNAEIYDADMKRAIYMAADRLTGVAREICTT